MFRRRFLVGLVFLILAVIGLGACSSSSSNSSSGSKSSSNPEDQIVDRKTFLLVQERCRARSSSSDDSVPCVLSVFALKAGEYCASQELSAAHPKCLEIQRNVKQKVADNFTENVKDIYKK